MIKNIFKKLIIPATGLFLLFNSCYTVKDQKVVAVNRISEKGKRLPGNYYTFVEKKKPSNNDPYGALEVYQTGKYEYVTNEEIRQTKEIRTGSTVIGGICIAGGAGLLCYNNTQWFSSNTEPKDAFLAGAAIGGIAWWLLVKNLNHKAYNTFTRPGVEYDFKEEKLLSNSEIQLSVNETNKSITTDNNGLLKYSPPFDFKLETSLTDQPIEMILKKKDQAFMETLRLMPANWMEKYVKISTPATPVVSRTSGLTFGTAREGIFYKVLDQDNNSFKIQIGSKQGWIDAKDATTLFAFKTSNSYSTAIKNYVIEEMEKWLKQGEFELPEDYIKRVSKKDEQLLIFTNLAMETFQKEHISYFDWKNSIINRYDPNSQTFKVEIPELNEYVISVPIEYAKGFKENWTTNKFKNQQFTLIDGNWELLSFEIEDPAQNYTCHYSSDIANHYDPTNQFGFDFKDFEVKIPELQTDKTKKQNETDDLDSYSIKTDLPQTGMSQPDAIAVVIGNAFYQKTAAVNYAINDAQLMKLYLTNVLGFKEGNIIFVMNATKAEFEGLFGTDSNHKGKLFNYIKPDISDVFIFYSGHGAPNPQTQEAYFIPTDCDPSYVELQAYALKTFYKNLALLPAKSTTVVLDACFSGAGILKNISSVRIKPKDNEENIKNSAILSSSSGTQVSSWYNYKRQGMFTYFFLKAIHDYKNSDTNKDNNLTIKEIYNYVSDKTNGVPYYARRLNAIEQNPVLKGSNTDRVFVTYQ